MKEAATGKSKLIRQMCAAFRHFESPVSANFPFPLCSSILPHSLTFSLSLSLPRPLLSIELPEEHTVVTGIQARYRIGDLVDGNCSIKYSKPAANLTWTINGIVVSFGFGYSPTFF